jgi:hypothetical protein
MDEFTPDAWHDLLGDLDPIDAKTAVQRVLRRQPFVAPAEIRAEVTAIRRERLDREVLPAPPTELADDQVKYREALTAGIARLAEGWNPTRALKSGRDDPSDEYDQARAIDDDPHRYLRVKAIRAAKCTRCKAPKGKRCRDLFGNPVQGIPAHQVRLVAAGLAEQADDEAEARRTAEERLVAAGLAKWETDEAGGRRLVEADES